MASILLSLFTFFRTLPAKYLGRFQTLGEIHTDAVVPEIHIDEVLPEIHTDEVLPETMQLLGAGKSGVVYAIDSERVLKEYHDEDASQIEHLVYKRLLSHPHIAKVLEMRTDGSIILERGTPLRSICRGPSASEIPLETKVQWLIQAARGYDHVHTHGIIHADVGSHNVILTGEICIKLIDFEGCSVDGATEGSCYEWFSYRASIPPVSQGTDIFAFGCMMYELSTGTPPYYELETSYEPYTQVQALYTAHRFPDVTTLALGALIRKCWYGDVGSMIEVVVELDAFFLFLLPT